MIKHKNFRDLYDIEVKAPPRHVITVERYAVVRTTDNGFYSGLSFLSEFVVDVINRLVDRLPSEIK